MAGFVFVTTDNGEGTKEPNVNEYNKFMNDFLARGGAAHAVIVQAEVIGWVTDIVANLVDNIGGHRDDDHHRHTACRIGCGRLRIVSPTITSA